MPKRSFKVDADDIAFLQKIKQENSLFSVDEAHSFALKQMQKGKIAFEGNIPENCKSCPKCGFIIKNGKMLCITKKTETDPIRGDWIPLEVAKTCSEKPFNTPINKKTREQFERELSNMEKMKIYHQKRADNLRPKAEHLPIVEKELRETKQELENVQKPIKNLYAELQKTRTWRLHLANYLLRIMNERKALETDNDFLRKQVEELSHDSLAEKNAFLTVELGKRNRDIEDLKTEIQKLEDLNKWEHQKIINLTSETRKMLRDFNQYLPTSLEPYDIQQYIKNIQKKIEQFENYLNTLLPSIP